MSAEIQAEIDYLFVLRARCSDELLDLKLKMLQERLAHHDSEVEGRKLFQASATKSYLVALVTRHPGLTRSELRDIAGIPGSPKRSAVDVFRDYLVLCRREFFVDADGRFWIKNDFTQPPIAKIGNVVLDGRITPTMKRALCYLRDNPGVLPEQLRKAMRLGNKDFRSLMSSLKTRTTQNSAGGLYVDGYIPSTFTAHVPEKQKSANKFTLDAVASSILEMMEPGTAYDWSELVPVYKSHGMSGKDGIQHIMKLVAFNMVRTDKGKFINTRSDI
jgi:hypothetical protein